MGFFAEIPGAPAVTTQKAPQSGAEGLDPAKAQRGARIAMTKRPAITAEAATL